MVTLVVLKAQALVDTVADTLLEARAGTVGEKVLDV